MIVACVKNGDKYGDEYVYRLRDAVERHLPLKYEFVCLSDKPLDGIRTVKTYLPGWWAKIELFKEDWREEKVLFFDLDMIILRDLTPLAGVSQGLAVLENFARLRGLNWPCRYSSSCMVIDATFGDFIYRHFKPEHMKKYQRYGDQKVIEELFPHAVFLQDLLPKNFFISYRDLKLSPPEDSAVVVFGGVTKPHNSAIPWVYSAWAQQQDSR